MTKMKRYSEYKDSGIKWIGEIPSHWRIRRTRYLCDICTGDKDTIMRDDNGIYPFYVRSPKVERINTYSYDGEAILMAGDGVGAGKVFHYVNGKFDYHQRVYNLHNIKDVVGKFLFYFIRDKFHFAMEENNAKNTVDSVRLPWLKAFPIPLPPISEQKSIVSYLDSKVSKIDEYIAASEKKIASLDELKQTIIADAVTHGINHDVKMKDSGIKWIGEVPEHWSYTKIKNLFVEISEKGHPEEPCLCSTQKYGVIPQSMYENRVVVVNKGLENLKFVRKGNFVISLRSFQGGIEMAHYQGIISAAYTILSVKSAKLDKDYIKHLFKSYYFIQLLQTCVTGIREGQNINYELLKKQMIPIPPLAEQQLIVSYIDKKVSEIDRLKASEHSQIDKLKEYKQRLISDVVTGKVKVTNH